MQTSSSLHIKKKRKYEIREYALENGMKYSQNVEIQKRKLKNIMIPVIIVVCCTNCSVLYYNDSNSFHIPSL